MKLSRMSISPIVASIAVAIATIPLAAFAMDGVSSSAPSELEETNSLMPKIAGLRIDQSNIISAFSGHLTRYFGDCPNSQWTGSATKDNVRFISYGVPPAKKLRVSMINLTSGESLNRKYTKDGLGSTDFRVLSLGENSGRQDIEYTIYNKSTDAILEKGNFSYDLTTITRAYRRDGVWRSEKFCASDEHKYIGDCDVIGRRQRLYCEGSKTSTVRGEYIVRRRYRKPRPW